MPHRGPTHHEPPDAAAFARLVEPHFQRLFRLAYRLTGSRADAEDLLQETFTRLYEQRDRLSGVDSLGPWLARVLYHRFVDDTRSAARRPLKLVGDVTELADGPVDDADPLFQTEDEQRGAHLARALARLSEEQRALVIMHDAEGYTLREIEAATEIPVGTLKSRLSRARARLRDLLRDLDGREGGLPGSGPGRDQIRGKNREPITPNRRVGG